MSLLTPEDLPKWVPGTLLSDSGADKWAKVRQRTYQFKPLDVHIPAMRDYLIVHFSKGSTVLNRRSGLGWKNEHVGPGFVSLMPHALDSDWQWGNPVVVQHLYLSTAEVAALASEILEKDIAQVELKDVVGTDDKVLLFIIRTLMSELQSGGFGEQIYLESLTNQLAIHLLRNYAHEYREPPQHSGGLTYKQVKRVRDYVDQNLEGRITLSEMAQAANLSVCHFVRQFQKKFGRTPYIYVTEQRLERVKKLLAHPSIPQKVIATKCGFSDQSHMARVFGKAFDITPGEFRKQMRN